MIIVTPNCSLDGCYQVAVGYRQPEIDNPLTDPWWPICAIHIFQPIDGVTDWRICFITQRESILQMSPS